MRYEVRDSKTNNYLFGTFRKYDDAVYCVDDLLDDELEEDDFEIVMVLTDWDKNILADKFTDNIRLFLSNDLRIVDTHVIVGYYPNDIFIKLLVVDKLHCPMLLSYSVTIDDTLDIVEFEQYSITHLS